MSGSLAGLCRRRALVERDPTSPLFLDCLTVQQIGVAGTLDIEVQLGADTLLLGAYTLDRCAIGRLQKVLCIAACLLAESVEGAAS